MTAAARKVVKLPKPKPDGTLDLRGDNMLPGLIDERETLRAELKKIQIRLKEVDNDLQEKMGSAHTIYADGWRITQTMWDRKEFVMPATTVRRVWFTRVGKRKG